MKLKQNKACYTIARGITDLLVSNHYNIKVNGAYNIPKNGSAICLSKHQSMWDIILQGFVLNKYVKQGGFISKYFGGGGNWVEKFSFAEPDNTSLKGKLQYFISQKTDLVGGVRFVRGTKVVKSILKSKNKKEAITQFILQTRNFRGLSRNKRRIVAEIKTRKILDLPTRKEQMRTLMKSALIYNKTPTEYLKNLVKNDQIIFLHPEGTRKMGEMGPINMTLVNYLRKCKEENNTEVPLVLMGIEYEDAKRKGSNVTINIKKLDWDTPNLEKTIYDELASLSGIKV